MSIEVVYLLLGIVIGLISYAIITHKLIIPKYARESVSKAAWQELTDKFQVKNTELAVEKEKSSSLSILLAKKEADLQEKQTTHILLETSVATLESELLGAKTRIDESERLVIKIESDGRSAWEENQSLEKALSYCSANLEATTNLLEDAKKLLEEKKSEIKEAVNELNETKRLNSDISAKYNTLSERLSSQKEEIEETKRQFNLEFQNIANKILEEKTFKFTQLNKENISSILKPLGENLEAFKKKVEEAYDKEGKERFSLGEELKKLVALNQQISTEAKNLTNALKGNSKVQGDWGQVILERILETSGLSKGREYVVQEFIKDEDDKYHRNELGNKMQPDVTIIYPDNRKVIIDAKASLTAYVRFCEAEAQSDQQVAIKEHTESMYNHINELSRKNYQDFTTDALDFVMMFVPNEPAYFLAVQQDPKLWQYAFSKRILLMSPTNLVTALKLVEELWKRDRQNKNTQAIAERGAALYDKFVGFVENIQEIGTSIDKSKKSYEAAFNQLTAGNGNLIGQAEKLKELGVQTKKALPSSLLKSVTGN